MFGRPVSYTDSFTFMTFSNYMKESVYVHYSPSYKQSIGVEVLEDKALILLMVCLDTQGC